MLQNFQRMNNVEHAIYEEIRDTNARFFHAYQINYQKKNG